MIGKYQQGQSASSIAKELGLYTTSVTRVLKRRGVLLRDTKEGENHPMWKGGEIVKNGYPMVYAPNHPRRYKIPYVPKHVLVVERRIGRTPKNTEHIHHVDCDRANYADENLYLCKDSSEHQRVHNSLDKVVSILIKNKVIKFKGGKYSFTT